VRTEHYSLKILLDQRLATIPQHHWVGKLLGFDFTVEYKPCPRTRWLMPSRAVILKRVWCWPYLRPGLTLSNAYAKLKPPIQPSLP
jgi:hypothetical protein